jgi:putative lipoic acid-binding regulatory protein
LKPQKNESRHLVQYLPAIELLESTHRFPGSYLFKVIGRSEQGFVARTVAAVRDAVAAEFDPPFSVRETSGGKHVAVTLEVPVERAEQVIAVYRRVQKLAGLVFLW